MSLMSDGDFVRLFQRTLGLTEDHRAGNPSILKAKTVEQFLTWLHNKTGVWAR